MSESPARILVVRTDRLGDVLLTTPVSSALRAQFPKAKITWLVRAYAAPLLAENPDVDEVIVDKGESVPQLTEALREKAFDIAICSYPRWRVVWALWRAGIPKRIGPASKIYSILFTDRLWQHRSEGVKHEADYNLELLAPLGVTFKRFATRVALSDAERDRARTVLAGHRIYLQKPLVILHPGSGGSSARWPLKSYMELGDRLQERGCEVVVTAGPGETHQTVMIDHMRRIPAFIPAGSVSVRELAALFSWASLVVTNSTGPLHLAVALGTPTVSMFSPLPTCHPTRWGPYPDYAEKGGKHGVAIGTEQDPETPLLNSISIEIVMDLCLKRLEGAKPVAAPLAQ